VVCDFLDAAINFPEVLSLPSILFQHNVESEIWRRHAEIEKNPAKKLLYSLEFKKSLSYEKATLQRFDQVIAVSEHDRSLMSTWTDAERIAVVPTGVDLEQYRPDQSGREPGQVVMFVGAMDWESNIDAVEYFCAEVWPIVLKSAPDARFRIVGRNPDNRVRNLASQSVEVTGRVAAVIDQLREAAVVVVPLRIGGGTRLKIYEAMAAGKAIVSTTVGAEGLDVHPGRDIVLADVPSAFAEGITKLLQVRDLRRRYERSAAELAARYDWRSVGETFEAVLQRPCGSSSHAGDKQIGGEVLASHSA
jgi:glycosyltransferase involved in cell wall biosynthesis